MFSRVQWADQPGPDLSGVAVDPVPADEMQAVFAPLAALVESRRASGPAPYVVALAGPVAVGKSAFSRALKAALERTPVRPSVEIVHGDGFLRSNAWLAERGLMQRKGFPESFDPEAIAHFFARLRSGDGRLTVPTYSHTAYDVGPDRSFDTPDIVIFEGVNALTAGLGGEQADLRLYLDAEERLIEDWYVERFLALRRHERPILAESLRQAGSPEALARRIWAETNRRNLRLHIAPSAAAADVVLDKGPGHRVETVRLRV